MHQLYHAASTKQSMVREGGVGDAWAGVFSKIALLREDNSCRHTISLAFSPSDYDPKAAKPVNLYLL